MIGEVGEDNSPLARLVVLDFWPYKMDIIFIASVLIRT
jgi:hypothetical protein